MFGFFIIVDLRLTLAAQIDEMKKHLERRVKAGKSKPRLKDLDPAVLPAAWSILRWWAFFFPRCSQWTYNMT
jgi:hypothetical protein